MMLLLRHPVPWDPWRPQPPAPLHLVLVDGMHVEVLVLDDPSPLPRIALEKRGLFAYLQKDVALLVLRRPGGKLLLKTFYGRELAKLETWLCAEEELLEEAARCWRNPRCHWFPLGDLGAFERVLLRERWGSNA